MARRFFGIDIDSRHLRVALLTEEKGKVTLAATGKRPCADAEELAAGLRELLGERHFGDRLAAALPAGAGFVRQLRFPFADPRKIAAALDFELAAQIPVPAEACLTDFGQPLPEGEGCRVAAAAVRSETVASYLEPFEAAELPLQTLDLAPFAFLAALPAGVTDGLLACLAEREATVALVLDDHLANYRLLPLPPAAADLTRFLLASAAALQGAAGRSGLPFFLLGPGATPELCEELHRQGAAAEIPAAPTGPVEAEFLPALTLARRAMATGRDKAFNFRRGAFALRSEWAALKRGLVAAGVLLVLSLLAFGGAAWLRYAGKAAQADALQQQMKQAFQQTFPGTPVVADVPLQMRSKIAELQKKGRLLGVDRSAAALAVVTEISRALPAEVKVDVRELSYEAEAVRLEGHTTSFDAINQLAKALEQSPLFKEARIADAKTSIDGKRVDFRLHLSFAQEQAR